MNDNLVIKLRQSSVRTFTACEMKYKLSVVDGLVPLDKSPALTIGTLCHAGRAEWLRTFDIQKSLDAVHKSSEAELQLFPAILERQPKLNKNGSHAANCSCHICIKTTALATVASYCQTFPSRFTKDDIVIYAVEQTFEREILTFDGLSLVWTGTVDADARIGRARVNWEFKTTSLEMELAKERERMSIQHIVYPYHLEKIKGERYYGTCVEISKKPTKENPAQHDSFYIVKTEEDYAQFERDSLELLRRVAYSYENDYWPQRDTACFAMGRCQYWKLCTTKFSRTEMQKFGVIELQTLPTVDEGEE